MQNKHIFVLLKFSSFFSYADSIIKELSIKNKVTLCIQDNNKTNSSHYYIDKNNNLVLENNKLNKKVLLAQNTNNLEFLLEEHFNDENIIVFMGAGSISNLAHNLVSIK